jgi:hypothetical protein
MVYYIDEDAVFISRARFEMYLHFQNNNKTALDVHHNNVASCFEAYLRTKNYTVHCVCVSVAVT